MQILNIKRTLFLIAYLILLISSCKTIKEEDNSFPEPNAEGWYVLKDFTNEQLKALAEKSGADLDILIESQDKGWIFRYENGIYYGKNPSHINDPVCDYHIIKYSKSIITLTPNPTSSYLNFELFAHLKEEVKVSNDYTISVECQLIYDGRIIRQWTIDDYSFTTETIPEEYLKEGGSYALVCNFTGPRGCTASTSASFMVIKK